MPTIEEFGRKVKEKYPQYSNVDDKELGLKMLEKYPQYKDRVFDTDPDTQAQLSGEQPTTGVWDAVKKGFSNIKKGVVESGQELDRNLNTNANPFVKTAKTATGLIKAVINPLSEAAIATPLRVAGEVAENVTGIDVNEATAKGIQKLVQKGLDTETAQKAMSGYEKLKKTDPEAAMALATVLEIADIATEAIGLK